MLILTRKISQQIIIGDDIIITIMGVKEMQVRIGIEAPKSLGVHRKEIYEKIQQEKSKENEIKENQDIQ